MKLGELIPQSCEIMIEDRVIRLRYDMTALLTLERFGREFPDIFAAKLSGETILQFFIAAGVSSEDAVLIFDTLGAEEAVERLRGAIMLALPQKDPLELPQNDGAGSGEIDFGRLYSYICDVMGKPEEFFWHSTLRELITRQREYAINMGYMKEPEKVQMFDDEGL